MRYPSHSRTAFAGRWGSAHRKQRSAWRQGRQRGMRQGGRQACLCERDAALGGTACATPCFLYCFSSLPTAPCKVFPCVCVVCAWNDGESCCGHGARPLKPQKLVGHCIPPAQLRQFPLPQFFFVLFLLSCVSLACSPTTFPCEPYPSRSSSQVTLNVVRHYLLWYCVCGGSVGPVSPLFSCSPVLCLPPSRCVLRFSSGHVFFSCAYPRVCVCA